jgi:hypothetical protein
MKKYLNEHIFIKNYYRWKESNWHEKAEPIHLIITLSIKLPNNSVIETSIHSTCSSLSWHIFMSFQAVSALDKVKLSLWTPWTYRRVELQSTYSWTGHWVRCVVRFTSLSLFLRENIYPVHITWEGCRVGGFSGLEVLQGGDTSLFYWDSNPVLSSP